MVKMVNILSYVGHMTSVIITLFCHYNVKATIDYLQLIEWVPLKLYFYQAGFGSWL